MGLSDIADITITTQAAAVTQAGFGVSLILAPNATFPERVRFYSDLDGVNDDFASTTPEYLMAQVVFSQSPCPEQVAMGRLTSKPTQAYTLTPVAENSATYSFVVTASDGTETTYSFTADSSATATEIVTGLKAAGAVSGLTEGGTTTLTLTADVAGAFFGVKSTTSPISNLTIEQTHTTASLSASLDSIADEDSTWYAILYPFNSTADAATISTWAESNGKLYIAATNDTRSATVATGSDSTSAPAVAKAASRQRTACEYHPNPSKFLDAALAGRMLPTQPGSETWMFKNLSGPDATTFTTTQLTNLRAKNCGYYYSLGGQSISAQGKVASGSYIDIIRGRDWLQARIQEGLANLLINTDKIPMTDEGIAQVEGILRQKLDDAVRVGLIASDYIVTVPLAADIDSANKANRILPDITFTATLQGAVHKVEVNGILSL